MFKQRSMFKHWAFRLAAVMLGLSPFLICEATLRISHWQPRMPVTDPFVDFQSVRPLFVADQVPGMMVTAKDRLEYFCSDSFPTDKASGEYCIFCVGGSTVQGRPYAPETSFTTWLEIALRAADPSRQWNVVNCGGVSYASYRLVPIIEEVLRCEPDLIVLYTGHNEFLEDRSYTVAKQTPGFAAKAYAIFGRLKCIQLAHQTLMTEPNERPASAQRTVLATEVDTLLDYRGGLESYHRDPQWRANVCDHFEINLRRMIQFAKRAGTPILLVDPAVNERDCPPFKSQHADQLSNEQRTEVDQMVARAIEMQTSDRSAAVTWMRQAVELDPAHAGNQFRLATWYDLAGQYRLAKRHFHAAIEEDVCPLRIIEPMHQIIQSVAIQSQTICIDIRKTFEESSDDGIPGDNLFFDHVHPAFHGHQLIAVEIAKAMIADGMVNPSPDWEESRRIEFERHWQSLDAVYFERGKQRLQGLRMWTEGRSRKSK